MNVEWGEAEDKALWDVTRKQIPGRHDPSGAPLVFVWVSPQHRSGILLIFRGLILKDRRRDLVKNLA